jgi:hypothetical protein
MAKEFLDYNPDTGITYYTDYDEITNRMHWFAESDVSPLLDHCAKLRNESVHTVKDEFFHYAKLPPIVQLQLLKKGINVFSNDPTEAKRARQEIEVNYPLLKTSYAKHI